MSLERKDLRLYLDAEIHEALSVLADIERGEGIDDDAIRAALLAAIRRGRGE